MNIRFKRKNPKFSDRRLKALLLNPPYLPKFSRQSRSPCVTKSGTIYYPYFLAYAAGVLEKEGFDVKLIDAVAKNMSRDDVVALAKKENPDFVVLDTSTPSIFNDAAVASAIKEAVPEAHITLVGTHPTALPNETLALGKIDSVCIGEYDYTLKDIAVAIESGDVLDVVAGIVFKKGGKIIRTESRQRIANLDELPFVSAVYKKHLNIRDYFYASLTYPQVTILTARGCPYNCSFCLTPDMPIITEKGMHEIGGLVEKLSPMSGSILPVENKSLPKVLSHDGRFHSIEAIMKRKVDSDITELKVFGNPFRLKLTSNHKIYSIRKGSAFKEILGPELIESDKLKKGDFVAIPRITETKDIEHILVSKLVNLPSCGYKRGLQIEEKIVKQVLDYGKKGLSTRKIAKLTGVSKSRVQTMIKKGENIFKTIPYELCHSGELISCSNSKYAVPNKILLNNDFLRLCGYFLSEGHIYTNKYRNNSKSVIFTFNKLEKKYIRDVAILIKKCFGLATKISDTKTAYQIAVNSTMASDVFLSLFGTGAPEKKIPLEWLQLPKEKQCSLLSGIFSGDGYYSSKKMGFNTVSKFFAEEVQMMLHRLGFATSLVITPKGKYESRINGRKIESKHDRYDVIVFGNKTQRELNSLIGEVFNIPVKKKHKSGWLKSDKFLFVPIISASKKKYNGEVYNVSVESAHSYTINGVAVANCNSPFKASYRPRSIENVVQELEYIQKELPEVKEIMFEDETFPAIKQRTLELCELMKSRGIKIKWSCNARVNTDIETLHAMKSAGCRLMCVGFETPNARVLKSINKRTTRDMQLEFMKNARKAGLLVNGCFVLGLDSDTCESIQETIDFSKELNPDTAQFYPLMVYPGTEDYKRAKEKGYLTTDDYSKWLTPDGMHNCVLDRPGFSGPELVKLCDAARRQFYLRPKYIAGKLVQGAKNPQEMGRIVKAGATFLKHLK